MGSMVKQYAVPAKDVKTDDGIVLGNELYRVFYAVENKTVAKDKFIDGKMQIVVPPNTIHISLISDRMVGSAPEIMIDLMVHEDHPLTVVRNWV